MKTQKKKRSVIFPKLIERSIRAKVTVGITVPMVLMLCIFTYIEYNHHRSVLLNNLSKLASYNGAVIKEALQHSMLESNFSEMQNILDAVDNGGDFRVISLLDTTGRVIFAPNGAGIDNQLDNRNPTCQPCHKLPASERPSGVVVSEVDGQKVFRSMQPIRNSAECSQCHDPQQKIIGLLLTDISVSPFENAFVADLRENLILGISTIVISAISANLIVGWLVTGRLEKVADALRSFRSARPAPTLNLNSSDEIGQLETSFNEMKRRIQTEDEENKALSEHLQQQTVQQQELLKRLITAQEDERKRVARELHDELGQSLSGLALQSQATERLIHTDPARAIEQLSSSRELIGKTTQQMYEMILALRPSVLDDLGLVIAIQSLAQRVLNGIKFTLDADGLQKRLTPEIETILYRIYQEGLTNIVKHSGADQVTIRLSQRDGTFEGEIADNGHGFELDDIDQGADNPHRLGLLGMQERLSLCGGKLNIITHQGEGTRIHISIPLAKGDE